jgi:hypothetical protein
MKNSNSAITPRRDAASIRPTATGIEMPADTGIEMPA